MARITLELPEMLSRLADVPRSVPLESATLPEALEAAVERYPALRIHLFDESGGFRQHVLCFHNETNTRWAQSLEIPLADGDRITIMQAVSGG